MKQFEKVTQSVETLAAFLSSDTKGDNPGCMGCAEFEVCTGHETCLQRWMDFLNDEAEPVGKARPKGITIETGRKVVTSALGAGMDIQEAYTVGMGMARIVDVKKEMSDKVMENLLIAHTSMAKKMTDAHSRNFIKMTQFVLKLIKKAPDEEMCLFSEDQSGWCNKPPDELE